MESPPPSPSSSTYPSFRGGMELFSVTFCKNKEAYYLLPILLSFIHFSGDHRQTSSVRWYIVCFIFIIFYQSFLSQTLMTHRTAGKGRGPSFIPLYHFHPLTNIQTFICNFACEMTSHIFNRTACIYQTATRWDLPPYRITTWFIDDLMLIFVYLLVDLILGFCYYYYYYLFFQVGTK